MSVRTYNPSVRVGNWNEDLCLEEEQLKDFLERKDNGELVVQKKTNFIQTVLKKVDLSNPADGYIHVGDRVCIVHTPTHSIISAHLPSWKAFDATQLTKGSEVTCSRQLIACPRSVFVITSYGDTGAKEGDIVCYGQPISLVTLSKEGGQLNLQTDRATFMKHSKFSREQEVLLEEDISYLSAWKFLCFNQEERLETEGMPVPIKTNLFINHCKTNQHLAVHEEWTYRTAFGREYEVTAHTHYNTHKAEDQHNHFMLATGDLEEAIACLPQLT